MKYIWIEIMNFLKNNIVKILVGILLITLLNIWVSYRTTEEKADTETNDNDIENIQSSDENNDITTFTSNAKPASFYFFVENGDDTPFTNNYIIGQYITSPQILQQASEDTGINLQEIVETTENKAFVDYTESGETEVLWVGRDGNSHLHELRVNVGNEEKNLEITNYFFEFIGNDKVPFLEDKDLYVFQNPMIKEISKISAFDDASEEVPYDNEFNIVQEIIIGIILGSVVTIGGLLIFSFVTKKLHYVFTYTLSADDYFFLIDKKTEYKTELTQLLSTPEEGNYIIIRENDKDSNNEVFDNILNTSKSKNFYEEYNSILKVNDPKNIKRIIYIVEEGVTSRSWYNKERKLSEPYNIPTIVVQVNNTLI